MDNQVFTSQNQNTTKNLPDSENSKKALIIIGVIFVVVLGIVGAYFLGLNSQTINYLTDSNASESLPTEIINSETPTAFRQNATNTPATKKSTITVTPSIKTKILTSLEELDGFWNSDDTGNNLKDIRIGRNATQVTRGFVSFDINSIPSDATIAEATLRLYQAQIIGNPYNNGSSIKVDHLTYGDSLDAPDYGFAAIISGVATLDNSSKVDWKNINVTKSLKDDIANARNLSQYRLHFQTETTGGNIAGDFVYFESGEDYMHTGNTPQLVIKYY